MKHTHLILGLGIWFAEKMTGKQIRASWPGIRNVAG
jgi:hypothetical protein